MMRLKSKLLSLNASKADKVKVYSPRNCEELRIPFKFDKTAKVVGKLASRPGLAPGDSGLSGNDLRLVGGVLVQNDFKLSLMDPEDLREYAGLSTTTIICKQRLKLSAAGVDLIQWSLEGVFGKVDRHTPEHDKSAPEKKGNLGSYSDSAPELVTTFVAMGCVTVRYFSNREVELEWEGNLVNDGLADTVMAVILGVESSPAAVKRKFSLTPPSVVKKTIKANATKITVSRIWKWSFPWRTLWVQSSEQEHARQFDTRGETGALVHVPRGTIWRPERVTDCPTENSAAYPGNGQRRERGRRRPGRQTERVAASRTISTPQAWYSRPRRAYQGGQSRSRRLAGRSRGAVQEQGVR